MRCMARVTIALRNDAGISVIRRFLERQYGRAVTTTDVIDFAVQQTSLKLAQDTAETHPRTPKR